MWLKIGITAEAHGKRTAGGRGGGYTKRKAGRVLSCNGI